MASMCGICGRVRREPGDIGSDLVQMMAAQRHRGWDSTGFALYGSPLATGFVVRALVDDRRGLQATLEALRAVTIEHGADFLEDPTWDESGQRHATVRLVVSDPTDLEAWTADCDALDGTELQSVGRSLEIVKDVGDAHEVSEKHDVASFIGTHGLGHARLATESLVSPVAGHPFWARPFPDVAIVHNGQLTNYFTWRRRLERAGYRFTSENDSELIAVWNSVRMHEGDTQEASLVRSLTEFDGVFTYLLATSSGIGLAKDRFAIKPLAVAEEPDGVAMATEEQALRAIYRDEIDVRMFEGPSMVAVWEAGVPALAAS
jgi:glutamate synthase domain-containing protein 1